MRTRAWRTRSKGIKILRFTCSVCKKVIGGLYGVSETNPFQFLPTFLRFEASRNGRAFAFDTSVLERLRFHYVFESVLFEQREVYGLPYAVFRRSADEKRNVFASFPMLEAYRDDGSHTYSFGNNSKP